MKGMWTVIEETGFGDDINELESSGFQSVVFRPSVSALPGNLSEMHLVPKPNLLDQKLGVGPRNPWFKESSR